MWVHLVVRIVMVLYPGAWLRGSRGQGGVTACVRVVLKGICIAGRGPALQILLMSRKYVAP